MVAEKSTLQTDAGVERNFQRELGAIGPKEFQGKSVQTNPLDLGALLSGRICMDLWKRSILSYFRLDEERNQDDLVLMLDSKTCHHKISFAILRSPQ